MTTYPDINALVAMNAQAVFDHVARHVLTQRRRCRRNDNCLYRDGSGAACAIGALIPQSCYVPQMEDRNLFGLVQWCWASPFPQHHALAHCLYEHQILLTRLQRLHDSCEPANWPYLLREIATDARLCTRVIDAMDPTRQPSRETEARAEVAFRALIDSIMRRPALPHVENACDVPA